MRATNNANLSHTLLPYLGSMVHKPFPSLIFTTMHDSRTQVCSFVYSQSISKLCLNSTSHTVIVPRFQIQKGRAFRYPKFYSLESKQTEVFKVSWRALAKDNVNSLSNPINQYKKSFLHSLTLSPYPLLPSSIWPYSVPILNCLWYTSIPRQCGFLLQLHCVSCRRTYAVLLFA